MPPKNNEKWVREFESRVFDIYPFRGTDRYEYDLYIPKAKDWLRTLLTEKDREIEEAVEEIVDFIHDNKFISDDLAGDWAISVYDLLEKIAPETIPTQVTPDRPLNNEPE